MPKSLLIAYCIICLHIRFDMYNDIHNTRRILDNFFFNALADFVRIIDAHRGVNFYVQIYKISLTDLTRTNSVRIPYAGNRGSNGMDFSIHLV